MNRHIPPEFNDPNFEFVGTSGLILFGDDYDRALSFTRDSNTSSYPLYIDIAGGHRQHGEDGFQTFKREVDEEFGIAISRQQIEYAKLYSSLANPRAIGWFTVARTEASLAEQIVFGDEGIDYAITTLSALRKNPKLIPRRALQIDEYLSAIHQSVS